ncbi:XK-related protein 9, partial [Varanus komodoensis]
MERWTAHPHRPGRPAVEEEELRALTHWPNGETDCSPPPPGKTCHRCTARKTTAGTLPARLHHVAPPGQHVLSAPCSAPLLRRRYWFILNSGYKAAFQSNSSGCTIIIHAKVIGEMADISMLRLFKTFLESTPQLILQVYILMISDNCTFSQYVFIAITFGSISCATLDYMIALWKSLPDKNKFTKISSKIIIVLIAGLSTACAIILVVLLWFSIIWVLKQHTAFCKTKAAEIVYRTVVGIILVFTFFNIKGERTKIPMSVYFVSRVFLTLAIMCICIFSKSMFSVQVYLSAVIITVVITLVLGIAFLCVYYGLFHPTIYYTQDVVDGPDAVDGPR